MSSFTEIYGSSQIYFLRAPIITIKIIKCVFPRYFFLVNRASESDKLGLTYAKINIFALLGICRMSLSAEVCSGQARDSWHTNSFLKYPANAGMISRLHGFVAEKWREKSLAERHRANGIKHNSRNVADPSWV